MGRAKALLKKDVDKAIALNESGFSQIKIADMFGCSRHAVGRAINEYKESKIVRVEAEAIESCENVDLLAKTASIEQIKERLSQKFTDTIDRIVDNVTDEDITKASLRDKAISAGIFFDKVALIRNINQQVDVKHTLVGAIRKSTNE